MIDAHRGAFEYEWRARFQLPLTVVGESMTWGEALRLYRLLVADPSSHIAAAVAEWTHPLSREGLILADLYDLQHASKAKKTPQPYPRPFDRDKARRRRGNAAGRTREQVIEILRRFGHGSNDTKAEVTQDG